MEKAASTKGNDKVQQIIVPKLTIKTMRIKLVGDSSLIVHAWSEKAKREMLDKQTKKAKAAKAAKDPHQDYLDSLYYLTPEDKAKPENERRYGFPSVAFKSAAVDACSFVSNVTKVEARGAFHIDGDMVEIHGKPKMRDDMVRIGMGTADIRFRGEFLPWWVEFEIRYNPTALSDEQIVNLFNHAGFSIGIGEWRMQKDGPHGMFHVET